MEILGEKLVKRDRFAYVSAAALRYPVRLCARERVSGASGVWKSRFRSGDRVVLARLISAEKKTDTRKSAGDIVPVCSSPAGE